MDHIELPSEELSLDAIAPNIKGLRIAFVNVFGITLPNSTWLLIDAGVPFSETLIRNWTEKTYRTPPIALVLTHGHFDHVSNAKALAEHWNVPVYAHPLEFPYLTGKQDYPAPNVGAGGGLMSLLSPLYPRHPIDLGARLRPLAVTSSASAPSNDGPLGPDWQVLHTPGHTPGHVSFFRSADKALLVGDAFCTTKPESFFEAALAQEPELHGPPAYFTSDWTLAGKSVKTLARLNPAIVIPGHGKPLAGAGVPAALSTLAAQFDTVAVPDNRK